MTAANGRKSIFITGADEPAFACEQAGGLQAHA